MMKTSIAVVRGAGWRDKDSRSLASPSLAGAEVQELASHLVLLRSLLFDPLSKFRKRLSDLRPDSRQGLLLRTASTYQTPHTQERVVPGLEHNL